MARNIFLHQLSPRNYYLVLQVCIQRLRNVQSIPDANVTIGTIREANDIYGDLFETKESIQYKVSRKQIDCASALIILVLTDHCFVIWNVNCPVQTSRSATIS